MRKTLKDILEVGLPISLIAAGILYCISYYPKSSAEIVGKLMYADRNNDGIISKEEWKQVSTELEFAFRNMNGIEYIPSNK